MLVLDVVVFSTNVTGQSTFAPLPLWIVTLIVVLEILAGTWLVLATYRRGLERLRLTWREEHPSGFVEGAEPTTPSAPLTEYQAQEDKGILDIATEVCARLNITKLQLTNLTWVGQYFPMGRGAMKFRPDMCYFGPGMIMVPQILKGKLNEEEWRPLVASSLVFDLKQRKLIGRLIVEIVVIVLGVLLLVPLGLFFLGVPGLTLVVPLILFSYLLGRRTRGKILLESDYEAAGIVGNESFSRTLSKIEGLNIHVSHPTIADRIKAIQARTALPGART